MPSRSRRQFMQEMIAATAAVAGSGVSSTWAAENAASEKTSSSPAEKLGVAVIGVNGRGQSHIGAFEGRKDTEILYIVDADEKVGQKRAAEVAKKQGRAPRFVQDMREAMADKSVDIVSTATPNHWHALVAIWGMQHGKDVYVEKPVSHNVSEGRRIVETARKYNKICQTGTQSRSTKGMHEAMQFLRDGKIGTVTVARGLCYKRRQSIGPKGNYQVPAEVNYDLWSGPAPLAQLTREKLHYNWHWQWLYGNGDLGNQGIHQMDIARWGLGVNLVSNGVFSYGGRLGYEDAGETANTQVVVHDYGDKALVFEVRGLETKPYKGAAVGNIFEGTNGYLMMSSYEAGAAFDKDGNKIQEFRGGGDHFANFIAAVRSRKTSDLNADILEGHLSSALCHLGNISYRLGQQVSLADARDRVKDIKTQDNAVDTFNRMAEHLEANGLKLDEVKLQLGQALTLDPGKETFVDNSTADAMLTREYRAPYIVPAAGAV